MSRETFAELDDAVEALRRRAEEIIGEGGLESVSLLREFEPGQRVAARLEISTGGWLRGRAVGVDVMGDGTLVPFRGGLSRDQLEPQAGESAFDAVKREFTR